MVGVERGMLIYFKGKALFRLGVVEGLRYHQLAALSISPFYFFLNWHSSRFYLVVPSTSTHSLDLVPAIPDFFLNPFYFPIVPAKCPELNLTNLICTTGLSMIESL
jgi:hypothetical protein